jgi:hypothetical protein
LALLRLHLTKRSFSALLVHQSVILSWMYIFASSISNRYPDIASWSRAGFSFSAALSILAGVFFMRKTGIHSRTVYAWSLISPIITTSLIFAPKQWFLTAVCLLGALYGGFLLTFFTSFGESIAIGERGRIGAIIGFLAVVVMLFLTMISLISGFVGSVVLCSVLSIFSFFATRLATVNSEESRAEGEFSLTIMSGAKRDFFLYLMPWLMYNLVNAILGRYHTPLFDQFQISILAPMIISGAMSCMGALIGGFLSDLHGRRKALGIGLTSYGISAALSGLFFLEMQNVLPLLLSLALDGFSWGIFLVSFFYVIWQDLSSIYDSFYYYAGLSLYPVSIGLAQFLPSKTQFPLVSIALISCVLILSSNIFLVAAHELLSPELRRETGLFVYLEQVKAFFKKTSGKTS